LQTCDSQGFAHIGNVEPHVITKTEGGTSLLTRRGKKQGHHFVLPLLDRVQDKLLFIAIGLYVDQFPVHLIGLRLHVSIDLTKYFVPVKGSRRSRHE